VTAYRVLALDLATTTGFAIGAAGTDVNYAGIRSGSIRLKGETADERGAALLKFMRDLYRVEPYLHVVYEAPLATAHMAGKTNVNTTMLLFGLAMIAGATAIALGVRPDRIRRARPDDVRRHFLGVRSAGGRDETKRAVMARCRALGRDPGDDNEADAIALLDYQLSLLRPGHGIRTSPLISGG
jgi:hypothetical protein